MTDRDSEAGAYAATPRTTLHRRKVRGRYDRATVHAILDEALVCHLGFVAGEQPFVMPTTFVREAESLSSMARPAVVFSARSRAAFPFASQ